MRLSLESLFLLVIASAVMGSGVGYYKLWLFHVTSLLFIFAWLLRPESGLLKKNGSLYWWQLVAFFVWYVMGMAWSINKIYTLQYLAYLLMGLWIVFLITSYVTTVERYERVFRVLTKVFFVAILIGLLESFTPFRLPTSPFSDYAVLFGRKATDFSQFDFTVGAMIKEMPTSFWGNPNNMAIAMAMIAPMCLLHRKRSVKYLATAAIVILISMAGSRGAFIGLVIGVLAMMMTWRRFAFLCIVIVISLFYGESVLRLAAESEHARVREMAGTWQAMSDYLSMQGGGRSSIGIRQELMLNGIDAFKETYGLGIGAGASVAVQEAHGVLGGNVTSMHNFIVEVLVEGGILGIAIFGFFYGSIALRLNAIRVATSNYYYSYHAGSLFFSMIIFLVACVSASSVIYFLPMWIMFGMGISLIKLHRRYNLVACSASAGVAIPCQSA